MVAKKQYKNVTSTAKKLVKFHYTSRLKELEKEEAKLIDGVYWPTENLICVHKPAKYDSQLHFALTLFHELAHWAMNSKNTGIRFKREFLKQRDNIEEYVAQALSVRVCRKLGYLHKGEVDRDSRHYTAQYRRRVQRALSKRKYAKCKKFSQKLIREVENYIFTGNKNGKSTRNTKIS